MRIRQLIIGVIVVSGIITAVGGFLAAWENDDMFVGSVWMIMGISLMAGATIYSLAMDDPQAREKALTTRHSRAARADGPTIDLREPETIRGAREQATTSHRVSL
jgi:hypothetical protein